jgi:NTE family protein
MYKRLLPVFFFLFCLTESFAQVERPKERPVVGIVLSGGGAKGFAHVGMLKIIDSLGIPIDFVGGTSMGSVVGSMYALGYSPDQIEQIVQDVDWDELMSNPSPRKYQSYLNKQTDGRYLFKANLKGLSVYTPSGYINGQKMLAKLNEVSQNYHGYHNFLEDFPRKFLCITADLRTGKENVVTEGSLADAVRASVSFPSLFTPYRIDGELKVDGGTVNNFPVDRLKELGCDIIIGLSVQSPPKDTLGEISFVEVLEHMGVFSDVVKNQSRVELCDILLNPNMKGVSLTDFGNNRVITQLGEVEARLHLEELIKLKKRIDREPYYPEPYESPDSVTISSLRVNGLKKRTGVNIEDMFGVETGETHAIEDLEESQKIVYGTDRFNKVQYQLLGNGPDNREMLIDVEEKSTNTQVGFNLHFDSDFGAAIGLNLTMFDALLDGATFGLDAQLRTEPWAKIYYSFDRGKYPGFYVESKYYSAKPAIYIDKNFRGNVKLHDWSTYVALQYSIKRQFHFEVGVGVDYQNYNFDEVPDWVEDGLNVFHANWAIVKLESDNLNKRNFATSGSKIKVKGTVTQVLSENLEVFTFDPFIPISFDYVQAITPVKWFTVLPRARAGVTLGAESSFPYRFFTGSFGKNFDKNNRGFAGYRFMEYTVLEAGERDYPLNIASAEIEARFNTGGWGYVSLMGGFGSASLDIKNTFNYQQYFGGLGIGYSLNTIAGPIQFIVHKSTDYKEIYAYFSLGYWL